MNQLPESNIAFFVGIGVALVAGWGLIEGLTWIGQHITIGWS